MGHYYMYGPLGPLVALMDNGVSEETTNALVALALACLFIVVTLGAWFIIGCVLRDERRHQNAQQVIEDYVQQQLQGPAEQTLRGRFATALQLPSDDPYVTEQVERVVRLRLARQMQTVLDANSS